MSTEIKEPDESSTIEEHFQHFLEKSFTRRQLGIMSSTQAHEMRKCFFGGMASLALVVTNSVTRMNLMGQLRTFWAKEMTRYQSDNN